MAMAKILMIDDDPEDRAIIIDSMDQLNADENLTCAENGVAALKLLSDWADQNLSPCLIVLDLNMPKMSGTQTLKSLKDDPRFRNIAVIIYSTSINPIEKEACMRLGAHSYVTKPISYKESLETARLFLSFCETESVT